MMTTQDILRLCVKDHVFTYSKEWTNTTIIMYAIGLEMLVDNMYF